MQRINLHATAVVAGQSGVLIAGPSGIGKSRLALALIGLFRARSEFATLVSDDQVWISVHGGRLVAEAPRPIAGLIEIRGHGPASADYERRAVIDRLVVLADPASVPRHRENRSDEIMGLRLPRLDLAGGDDAGAARAVAAWLKTPAIA